jgi:hypothetical protein
MPFPALVPGAADRNSLIKQDVVADFGRLADYDSQTVIDEQPFADSGTRVNLNSGDEAGETGDEPGWNEQPPAVQKMGYAMEKNGVKSLIAKQNL